MPEILTYINSTPIRRNLVENLPYHYRLKSRARALRKIGNYSEVIFGNKFTKENFIQLILTDKE